MITPHTGGRLAGRASGEGTRRFTERFAGRAATDHFRDAGGWRLSSLGIGTYLGEPTPADDTAYTDSVEAAVRAGCNIIDTAVNYRAQRSERSVGTALRRLFSEGGDYRREEILVATKGGFLPFDGVYPRDPAEWVRTALIEPGILDEEEIVAGCHAMTPRYLASQIDWSRRNLGLDCLDIYYLHNPETQLQEVELPSFLDRLRDAFELLEEKAASGIIGVYGIATWDGLRVPPESPGHLPLQALVKIARGIGGERHHFRAVQLPVNLVMSEACLAATQAWDGKVIPLLTAAEAAGMVVMSSGSLLQGRIINALTADFARLMPQTRTNAQRGLQVVRSAPGLAAALVGMRRAAHVEENLELARIPRLMPQRALEIMSACRRS